MLRWFDTKEVDALADSIVAELRDRVPSASIGAGKRRDAERARKAFAGVFGRVDAFFAARRVNLYQKARFGNRVRWALREAGYPDGFVEEATRELVMHAAISARKVTKIVDR